MSTSRSLAKLFFSEASWLFLWLYISWTIWRYTYTLPPCRYRPHRVLLSQFFSLHLATWMCISLVPDRMPRNETTLCIGFLWHAWYPVERWCHCRMSRRNRLLSHHCLQCIIALASIHSVTSRATLAYTCKQLEPLVCWVNNQSNLWFGHDSV